MLVPASYVQVAAAGVIALAVAGMTPDVGPAARVARSPSAKAEFIRQSPCPATGKTYGACPGWQVDHVRALCDGGEDHPRNMQWLTVEEHKIKTRSDAAACRRGVPAPLAD